METIKDLPLMERPREKLLHHGPIALSNAELIAILLGSGTRKTPLMSICNCLVNTIQDQPQKLADIDIGQLCEIKGIGQVKAIIIAAAIELGKRANAGNIQAVLLETFDQVATFLSPYLPGQESAGYFLVMCNNRKELLATQEFPLDNHNPPSVKSIIQISVSAGAAEIILCRSQFNFDDDFLNSEKAFISQLDAAAAMMNVGMRGLVIVDAPE
jgi:DNA repair protein RadC